MGEILKEVGKVQSVYSRNTKMESTDFFAIKQPFTQRDCIIHLESYPPQPCEEKKRPRHVEEHKHFSAICCT